MEGGADSSRTTLEHIVLDCAKARAWDQVKELLDKTPDLINVQPEGRWSCLHQAAEAGDTSMITDLLARRADVNVVSKYGETPLDVATGSAREVLRKSMGLQDPSHSCMVEDACRTISLTEFRGSLRFPAGFRPDGNCEKSLSEASGVLPEVALLPHILEESKKVAANRLQSLDTSVLDFDQALAVAVYSYDLGFMSSAKGSDNFYVVLNEKLRARQKAFVEAIRNYAFFLLTGLEALPAFKGEVFRGVPAAALPVVREKYQEGTEVYWSAVTSTSTTVDIAKQFAEGVGGVIFCIRCRTGRSIAKYSAISTENEIILTPNTKLAVTSSCTERGDGYFYVDLLQLSQDFPY